MPRRLLSDASWKRVAPLPPGTINVRRLAAQGGPRTQISVRSTPWATLVRFVWLAGPRRDLMGVPLLLARVECEALIADRDDDRNVLRAQ